MRRRIFAAAVTAILSAAAAGAANAAPLAYDESVGGDLDLPGSVLMFDDGLNTVRGTVGIVDFPFPTPSDIDVDTFDFVVPTGSELFTVKLIYEALVFQDILNLTAGFSLREGFTPLEFTPTSTLVTNNVQVLPLPNMFDFLNAGLPRPAGTYRFSGGTGSSGLADNHFATLTWRAEFLVLPEGTTPMGVVPVPAALPLMATGALLLVAAGIRRRRR